MTVFIVRTHRVTIDYIEAPNLKAAVKIIRAKYATPDSLSILEVVDGKLIKRVAPKDQRQ